MNVFLLAFWLFVSGGISDRDLPEGSPETMQAWLVEKIEDQIQSEARDRSMRAQVRPRWIPRQLLEMDPASIEEVRLEGVLDRHLGATIRIRDGREFQAQFQLDLEQQLPVAARRIEEGTILNKEDLIIRWIPVPRAENRWIQSSEALIGGVLRSAQLAGEPFEDRSVTGAVALEAGDPIRLIYREAGLEVVMDVEARQSGAVGETIVVYNRETRRRYMAVVQDSETAIWRSTL